MKIAIIDAEGLYAIYFDGQIKEHTTYLDFGILEMIMTHASEFGIPPTIDSYEYFYLEDEEQYHLIDKTDGVFPDSLSEAKTLYGLE